MEDKEEDGDSEAEDDLSGGAWLHKDEQGGEKELLSQENDLPPP